MLLQRIMLQMFTKGCGLLTTLLAGEIEGKVVVAISSTATTE
jgi:hypothetical protein